MPVPPSLAGPLRLTTRVPKRFMEGGRAELGYPTITLNDHLANQTADFPPNTLYTTKYTIWSFIPKVLYEQFRKATSFYFLLIAILVSIPAVSPINPLTSWIGLIFILGVAAVREAYEDFLRTKSDNKVNSLKFTKIDPSTGLEKQICSHEIQVGDMLMCRNNNRIPADLVMVKSSFPDGTGFIETAQLDGETNLKIRYSAGIETYEMTQGDLCRLQGTLQADAPNSNLYSFKGSLRVDGLRNFSLDEKNLCLSGSVLRNTDFIIGIVVYAGVETKLGLNLSLPPSKFSALDKKLNRYIGLLFAIKIFIVIVLTINNVVFEQSAKARVQQLIAPVSAGERGVRAFVTYFALLSSLIPLSLVVTLEIVRFIQAIFMEWDETFYHEDKEATATTSNLNDQLALVDYVFSDKTGTLTENIMTFKKASVNGAVIDDSNNEARLMQIIQNPIDQTSREFTKKYLKILVLAHSCQPDEVKGRVVYKSASPDEEALCNAARDNGYTFIGRKGPNIIVNILGQEKVYQLLTEIEFSSERRRMSMIVRTPKNKILMLSKGADVEMQKRIALDPMNQQKLDVTNKDLFLFSTQGLRTLILGYKVITPEDYEVFRDRYNQASNLIDNREAEVAAVCDAMERDLQLVGATAIEDRLQAGVPKTIHNLRRAGIKVWLITGDKDETAVNIGFSSNLLSQDMALEYLTGSTSEEVMGQLRNAGATYLQDTVNKKRQFAFVVNGKSLSFIIRDFPAEFVEVAQHCVAVVCARVTPLQKAEVVKMVQEHQPDSCCLSIGDGGNDVSMIQQADIGIGIKGREGGQAARASDFAVPQFRHLQRLLFIHGRYSLLRNTKVIYMSFYKNITVFVCNAYFGLFNGGSGQNLYDDWLIVFYNIVFTSLPVFVVGLFERDLHESIIDRNPPIYRSQKKLYFFGLIEWILFAFYHSFVLFASCAVINHLTHNPDGTHNSLEYQGLFVITIGLEVILLKFLLETFDWSIVTAVGHSLSVFGLILVVTIENYAVSRQLYVPSMLFRNPIYWAAFFIVPVICLLPDFTLKYLNRQLKPKAWHILQEKYVLNKDKTDSGIKRRYSSNSMFSSDDKGSRLLVDIDESLG